MINNIVVSLAILLLVLISSFAMFLPLLALSKDKLLSQKFAIPFSISIEIIIGYLFYCTNSISYFPISYLIIALIANIWSYLKLKPIIFEKIRLRWPIMLMFIIVLTGLIYTRYFDSFSFVGPGGNDTYWHLKFVNDLLTIGHLSNGYYAPGFHIFLVPIAKIIPLDYLYRFTGPALGLLTVLSLTLLIKDHLKNKILLLLFFVLLVLPIFNPFTLQTINFFSSSLSFIYVASFIFLASDQNVLSKKPSQLLMLVFVTALALTVPYLFVVLIPAFLLILAIEIVGRKSFKKKYTSYLFKINILLLVGFILSLSHVYIQSNLLKRYYGFPGIAVTSLEPSTETSPDEVAGATSTDVTSNDELTKNFRLPRFVVSNSFLKPMIGTGIDTLRIKNVRSYRSLLGFGAYFWIFLSFLLLIYALGKKNSTLFIVVILSIFFGLCTQTGLFEMSYYRGRSGWYLLMLSILGMVLLIDQISSPKTIRLFLPACIVLSITGFFLPPQFYRYYYDEEFSMAEQISKQNSGKTITLIANNPQLDIVAKNIIMKKFKPESLSSDAAFLFIEKKIFRIDPVLSRTAVSTDKNFVEFNNQFEEAKKQFEEDNKTIKSSELFKNYSKFYESSDFIIYYNTK